MNALVFGLGAALLGTVAHIIALCRLPPKWSLLTLPGLLLIALGGLVLFAPPPDGVLSAEDVVVALVLAFSLGFAYALVLNGVLYDSPTLSLVNAIVSWGAPGMPVTAFDTFVAQHPFVQGRLHALVAAGQFGAQDGELRLTGNAVHLLRWGGAYRRLRGGSSSEAG